MVARTDLAWRVLQIIALALPALGILLQVIAHLDWEGYDSRPHHYRISSALLFLIVPITGAGMVSAGVIFLSYNVLWLRLAVSLMAISFLFVPLILFSVHKGARVRNVEFLDREKDAIARAAEQGEINEEEAEVRIERIEIWQDGFLRYVTWQSNRVESALNRHPLLFFGFYGFLFLLGVFGIIRESDVWGTLAAVWLILYPLARMVGRFVPDFAQPP